MSPLSDHECLETLRLQPRRSTSAQQAFAALFERYDWRLKCHLRARFSWLTEEELVDSCQETWLRAWKGMDANLKAPAFRTWLYRVGENLVIDQLRRPARKNQINVADGDFPSPHPNHEYQQAYAEQLRQCVEKLPEKHRRVLNLLLDLRTYDEIATQIQVPKGRLYQLKLEAGRLLEACLEGGS